MSSALDRDETVASAVCLAASKELGEGWLLWEPETIWKELHHRGIDVSVGNRQQLMAGRGLIVHGRFFYDGLIFDKTCAAFANEVLDVDGFDDTLAMHLAWGVDEARKILELFDDDFLLIDREPCEVVATQLFEEGFVLAPDELAFAQPALDRRLTKEARELKREVQELWTDLRGHQVRDVPYPETAKGVQLARLASVSVFPADRRALRVRQLSELGAK